MLSLPHEPFTKERTNAMIITCDGTDERVPYNIRMLMFRDSGYDAGHGLCVDSTGICLNLLSFIR